MRYQGYFALKPKKKYEIIVEHRLIVKKRLGGKYGKSQNRAKNGQSTDNR